MGCSRCGQSRQVSMQTVAPVQTPIAQTKPEDLVSTLDAPQDAGVTTSTLDSGVAVTQDSASTETLPPDLPSDTQDSQTIESMQSDLPTVAAEDATPTTPDPEAQNVEEDLP